MKAAVDPAAKASVKMEEAAPAVMGGDGQWPAVLGLGWWPVAAMAEMAGEKAASTMSRGGGSDGGGGCRHQSQRAGRLHDLRHAAGAESLRREYRIASIRVQAVRLWRTRKSGRCEKFG